MAFSFHHSGYGTWKDVIMSAMFCMFVCAKQNFDTAVPYHSLFGVSGDKSDVTEKILLDIQ